MPHATIVLDALPPDATADALDIIAQIEAVETALHTLGWTTDRLPLTLDLDAARHTLRRARPDLVFNMAETLGGAARLVHFVPALLEELGLPFTGSSADAMYVATNKPLAKRILRLAGLPTPAPLDGKGGPWIVKSVWEHASIGIEDDSIVDSAMAARERIAERTARYGGEWFAEAFIDGREFNVTVLAGDGGPQVMPPAEIRFAGFPPGKPRIVNYAAKWIEDAPEYHNTVPDFEAASSEPDLAGTLQRLARECWDLFELRGYARVDFRIAEDGRPWILDLNRNPCLSPDAGLAIVAERTGIGYTAAIGRIVADALRGRTTTATPTAPDPVPEPGPAADLEIRDHVTPTDIDGVREMVRATGFFSVEEIGIAVELVEEGLAHGAASGYEFVFLERDGRLLGYTCYGRTPGTAGAFDLYWIVVSPDAHRQGVGRMLLEETDRRIRERGGTCVYAETSARDQYTPTRLFYLRTGFRQEAVLPSFYAPGEAKVIFSREIGA